MNGDNVARCFVTTPAGMGALGIVRVVGEGALSILNRVFESRSGRVLAEADVDRLRYGSIHDETESIDDAVVSLAIVSGIPTIDIAAHGGIRVLQRVLSSLAEHGAEIVETPPAASDVWSATGRIEAEALDALVQAKTARAVRFLSWQRENLADSLRRVAGRCATDPEGVRAELESLLQGYDDARRLLHGAKVVLVGPPNSGKSTLFNRLVGRNAAMVAPRAGTTRDWVTASTEFDGIPATLVDTAGRRLPDDDLESLAVESGCNEANAADLRILVLDGVSISETKTIEACVDAEENSAGTLIVLNKADRGAARPEWVVPKQGLWISAETGAGIGELTTRIATYLGSDRIADRSPYLFTGRQHSLVAQALRCLLDRRPNAATVVIARELIGAQPIGVGLGRTART